MARKPTLLVLLLLALAIAGWWIAREARSHGLQPGSTPQPEGSTSAGPSESELAPSAADQARAALPPEPGSAAQSAEAVGASAFFLRGRTVDARRFAAGAVEVRLLRANGATSSARSDEQGRFEFTIPARPEKWETVTLWASRDDTTAFKTLSLPGSKPRGPTDHIQAPTPLGDVDAGALTLRQAQTLQISIVEGAKPAAQAEVSVRLGMEPAVVWRGTSDASGMLTSPPFPDGCTSVEAVRDGMEGRARVFLPQEREVRIELASRFEAQITLVEKTSGVPIAGAVVELEENIWAPSSEGSRTGFGEYVTSRKVAGGSATTDASGLARFPGLCASADYRVRVRAQGLEDYPPQGYGGEGISAARPNLRLELGRIASRRVRWPIEAGEVPNPPEGARVSLVLAPGSGLVRFGEAPPPPREAVVRDGQVVAEAIEGRGSFLGTAPDSSIARFYFDEGVDLGRPVSFRKPRTIEVHVQDGGGAPVANALAQARNQGNNPMGEPAHTGADGIARLTGLYGELADVYVIAPVAGAREVKAGSVNLASGDGRVEAVLATPKSLRARLEVRIEGKPQLPPEYQLNFAKVLEEFPERGELLLELAPPEPGPETRLYLSAPGYLPALVKLPIPSEGTKGHAVMELAHGATLTALITRPRSKEWISISIQSWNEAKRAWAGLPGYYNGLSTPNGPGGSFRFFQLAPGRYQVFDERSKIASEPVEIAAGETEASVALDLDGVEWVSGRVEVPDPAEWSRARVLCGASQPDPREAWLPGMQTPAGVAVSADGSFKTQVKRGVSTKLRAWHPWLAPSGSEGEIVVDAGRDGVVLKLEAGDQLRIGVPQLVELRQLSAARVAVYDGPVQGEPRAWLHAPLVDGALRFTGVARGRATLWIDAGRDYAPLVLADLEIGPGLTDLGTATFLRGSSLRVRQSVKEGQAAARIYISAQREKAPAYIRDLNSNGEAVAVLSGLEAGSYSVSYGAIMGGKRSQRQIELDGVSDVDLELE